MEQAAAVKTLLFKSNYKINMKILSQGVNLIAQERKEQLEKHKRSIESDVEINLKGQLAYAATALLEEDPNLFPDGWNIELCNHMINKDRVAQLSIAGALIAAEIDRLLYLQNTNKTENIEENLHENKD